jgi:hypothetical protein
MDAYLEEVYDILTYCIQNPDENMFYSIEFRIKEEIDKDASQYGSWWNNISNEWKY